MQGSVKSPRSVRRVAMDCLARREHSRHELQLKLQGKFPDTDSLEIKQALSQLCAGKYLDDARFTESLIRYRKSRGFGFCYIQQELKARGVSTALIRAKLFEDDDWQILESLLERKLGRNQAIKAMSKEYRRWLRFLKGRGFSNREIMTSLKRRLEPAA
jgi:regulatory protein